MRRTSDGEQKRSEKDWNSSPIPHHKGALNQANVLVSGYAIGCLEGKEWITKLCKGGAHSGEARERKSTVGQHLMTEAPVSVQWMNGVFRHATFQTVRTCGRARMH
jgi:hypothetical protein